MSSFIEDIDFNFLTEAQYIEFLKNNNADCLVEMEVYEEKFLNKLSRKVYLRINYSKNKFEIEECLNFIRRFYFPSGVSFSVKMLINTIYS